MWSSRWLRGWRRFRSSVSLLSLLSRRTSWRTAEGKPSGLWPIQILLCHSLWNTARQMERHLSVWGVLPSVALFNQIPVCESELLCVIFVNKEKFWTLCRNYSNFSLHLFSQLKQSWPSYCVIVDFLFLTRPQQPCLFCLINPSYYLV